MLLVKDLGSSNGTLLNGKKIEGQRVLEPGDELVIGPVKLRVEKVGQPATAKVRRRRPPSPSRAIPRSPRRPSPRATPRMSSRSTSMTSPSQRLRGEDRRRQARREARRSGPGTRQGRPVRDADHRRTHRRRRHRRLPARPEARRRRVSERHRSKKFGRLEIPRPVSDCARADVDGNRLDVESHVDFGEGPRWCLGGDSVLKIADSRTSDLPDCKIHRAAMNRHLRPGPIIRWIG